MAVAVELEKTRVLVDALENEKRVLGERLQTERASNALLTELATTRKSENDSLRITVGAKNETIAAKDNVIAAQEKLVAELKRKKPSIWRRIGDVLIGAATVAVLR